VGRIKRKVLAIGADDPNAQFAGAAAWALSAAMHSSRLLLATLFAAASLPLDAAEKPRADDRNPGGAPASFKVRQFKAENGHTLDYSLFTPAKVEGKLPLVICLHGSGGNTAAAKVVASAERQAKHPCFVLAPTFGARGNRWVDSPLRNREGRAVLPELMGALDALLRELPIDPDRIYLTGQSMGGIGTWGAIALHSDRFAAAVPVCGYWAPGDAPKMKRVPIWAFHGEQDKTVPVEGSRQMIAALKATGVEPSYTELPGVGHNSWDAAYATEAMWDWMFAQKRTR